MTIVISADVLGFEPYGPGHWRKQIRGRTLDFRELRTRPELELAERMQREVMKLADDDMVHVSVLERNPETGGFTLAAFDAGEPVAVLFGFAEHDQLEPYLLSDFLAVLPHAQSSGIGFQMKCLQAAIASEHGFASIHWTVDPLRAANARLNFERLGALGIGYERNKYGDRFGAGLYGGMPTDRLLVRWPLTTERTIERLTGDFVPRPNESLDALEEVAARSLGSPQLSISIPGEIDHLVKKDFDTAMRYRLHTRDKIELVLDAGYFISGAARSGNESRLLAEPAAMFEETGEDI